MNDQLVQEAYYGKLPEFEKMEKLFESAKKRAQKEGKRCNPNKYPEIKKIGELFSKLFGFKKSILYFEPFDPGDAYTYSINTFLIFANRKEKMIKKQQNGFYDTSHTIVLTVYLSSGLLTFEDMSPREMIAVILHEIGHNFDLSGYHLINYYIDCLLSFGIYALQASDWKNTETLNDAKMNILDQTREEYDKFYNNEKKREKYNKRMKQEIREALKTSAKFSIFDAAIGTILTPIYVVLAPISQFANIAGKKSELFADSFAAAYGYSTELVSALEKLSDTKKYYNPKSGVMQMLLNFGKLQSEVLTSIFDVHGSNQERCYQCEVKLRKDLKRGDYPPELKEELEKEIERIHESYVKIVNMPEEKHVWLTRVWRKINKIFFRNCPNLISKLFKTNRV